METKWIQNGNKLDTQYSIEYIEQIKTDQARGLYVHIG